MTPFVSALYFLLELPSTALILRHGRYGGAPEVDTGGACWETAIHYQTLSKRLPPPHTCQQPPQLACQLPRQLACQLPRKLACQLPPQLLQACSCRSCYSSGC